MLSTPVSIFRRVESFTQHSGELPADPDTGIVFPFRKRRNFSPEPLKNHYRSGKPRVLKFQEILIMKRFGIIIHVIILMTAVLAGGSGTGQTADRRTEFIPIRVCSCNLRGALLEDGENSWSERRSICLKVMRRQNADIYCFQEMQTPNREAIEEAFPDYRFFGALDRPGGGHPMNGILYRKSRFRECGAGTYALSDHPHMIGSADWKNKFPRFVNFLILQEIASGKIFRIINTHLDHQSQIAREKSTDMINEESAAYPAELPQILTGDMNSSIDNPALQKLLQAGWIDSFREATGIVEPGFTYHAFRGPEYTGSLRNKIDFIFVRGSWKIIDSQIVKDRGTSGHYPSDHYFVRVDLGLK